MNDQQTSALQAEQADVTNRRAIHPGLPTQAQLFAALAKAHGNFPAIPKNREAVIRPRDQSKTPYKFRYADLEAIMTAVRGPLSKEGLVLLQPVNGTRLTTILAHESGESIRSDFEMGPWLTMGDPKNFGITLAYFRRYEATSMLCLAADDDLDVNEDEPDNTGPKKETRTVNQPTAKADKPAAKDKPQDKPAEPAPTASEETLTAGQLKVVRAKLKSAGLEESFIAEQFGVDNIEAIPFSKVNDVIGAITSAAA